MNKYEFYAIAIGLGAGVLIYVYFIEKAATAIGTPARAIETVYTDIKEGITSVFGI